MSFPEQPFGFVAGRWVLSIGDTPDDPDRAPDYVPVRDGAIVFTPQVTHRVAADGSGWAGIIKDRVLGGVGERGQLVDAEGHDHLALAVGVYSVSYDFGPGMSWPSHYIEVKPEHTADAPLWLPPIAPPPEGPRIENRVVTIPADGEDGQVLVWDGAGFSWADVPEGPQGPAGEVTTAALTTALAGKVTGTGMTLRYDTSVGERVLLDHPGGSTMLWGDTGWRNIYQATDGVAEYGTLPEGWAIGSIYGKAEIDIRRIDDRILIRIQGIKRTTGGTSTLVTLPQGFTVRPRITTLPCNTATTASIVQRRVTGTSATVVPEMNADDMFGQPQNNYPVIAEFFARDSWPTSQPGQPGAL